MAQFQANKSRFDEEGKKYFDYSYQTLEQLKVARDSLNFSTTFEEIEMAEDTLMVFAAMLVPDKQYENELSMLNEETNKQLSGLTHKQKLINELRIKKIYLIKWFTILQTLARRKNYAVIGRAELYVGGEEDV